MKGGEADLGLEPLAHHVDVPGIDLGLDHQAPVAGDDVEQGLAGRDHAAGGMDLQVDHGDGQRRPDVGTRQHDLGGADPFVQVVELGLERCLAGGSSGRATGSHLHYEVLRAGKQINPLKIKLPSGAPLRSAELESFQTARAEMDRVRQRLLGDLQVAYAVCDFGLTDGTQTHRPDLDC